MPLELHLNAIRRTYLLARSRNSMFLIEECRTEKTTGECWTWHIAGASAAYGAWIINQKCCCPEIGEPLFIETADPANQIITSKLRSVRKV